MLLCACAYGVKSEISLDIGDSASNAVVKFSVFVNQRCAECVCLHYDRPVTSLGHQAGEEFSERGPNFLSYV